jgi:ribosome maturation factor RimP
MDRAAVTQRVWELSGPVARAAGLELVDVQYRPEGGRLVLRLLLDRPDGGVTLEELARMSRELGDLLDAHDAVPGRYHLECSSPGLDRPLVRPEHFQRAVGQRVHVRTHDPVGGRRQFHGVLEAVADGRITVHDPDAGSVSLALDGLERARTEFEFPRPGRKDPRRPGHARA